MNRVGHGDGFGDLDLEILWPYTCLFHDLRDLCAQVWQSELLGCDVHAQIKRRIRRKLFLPRFQLAGGILHELTVHGDNQTAFVGDLDEFQWRNDFSVALPAAKGLETDYATVFQGDNRL